MHETHEHMDDVSSAMICPFNISTRLSWIFPEQKAGL